MSGSCWSVVIESNGATLATVHARGLKALSVRAPGALAVALDVSIFSLLNISTS